MFGKEKVKVPEAPKKPKSGKRLGILPGAKGKKPKNVKETAVVVPVEEVEAPKKPMKDSEVLKQVVDIIVANGGLETFENAMRIAAASAGEVAKVEKNAFGSFIQYRPCKYRTGNGFKDLTCSRLVAGEVTPVTAEKCKKCNLIEN